MPWHAWPGNQGRQLSAPVFCTAVCLLQNERILVFGSRSYLFVKLNRFVLLLGTLLHVIELITEQINTRRFVGHSLLSNREITGQRSPVNFYCGLTGDQSQTGVGETDLSLNEGYVPRLTMVRVNSRWCNGP